VHICPYFCMLACKLSLPPGDKGACTPIPTCTHLNTHTCRRVSTMQQPGSYYGGHRKSMMMPRDTGSDQNRTSVDPSTGLSIMPSLPMSKMASQDVSLLLSQMKVTQGAVYVKDELLRHMLGLCKNNLFSRTGMEVAECVLPLSLHSQWCLLCTTIQAQTSAGHAYKLKATRQARKCHLLCLLMLYSELPLLSFLHLNAINDCPTLSGGQDRRSRPHGFHEQGCCGCTGPGPEQRGHSSSWCVPHQCMHASLSFSVTA